MEVHPPTLWALSEPGLCYSLLSSTPAMYLVHVSQTWWSSIAVPPPKSRFQLATPPLSTEWDGWMASPTQWTWIWTNSGRWWRTGRPDVLQSMGLQRVAHDFVTEKQQQTLNQHFLSSRLTYSSLPTWAFPQAYGAPRPCAQCWLLPQSSLSFSSH